MKASTTFITAARRLHERVDGNEEHGICFALWCVNGGFATASQQGILFLFHPFSVIFEHGYWFPADTAAARDCYRQRRINILLDAAGVALWEEEEQTCDI